MILMYHNISDQAGFNTVSAANFVRQITYLAERYLQVVPMDHYVTHLSQGKALGNQVVLSFDDAYESFQKIALPLLRSRELPAIVYVPTDFVGQANTWDDGAIPIMDWSALKAIAKVQGVSIGSHGVAHSRMQGLSMEEIAHNASTSKTLLQQQLEVAVHHFSYPYGQLRDFDRRCQQQVRTAGYRSACSTLWGRSNAAANLYALHRIEIEPQDDLRRFSAKISRPFHPKYFRQRAKNLLFRLGLRR